MGSGAGVGGVGVCVCVWWGGGAVFTSSNRFFDVFPPKRRMFGPLPLKEKINY